MSFSTDVKTELCEIRTDGAAAEAECYGMLCLCRSFSLNKILLQTGCLQVAEHFVSLLRRAFDIIAFVKAGGSKVPTFTVEITGLADRKRIFNRLGLKADDAPSVNTTLLMRESCLQAFVRGAFLAGGSVSDPEKEYRADFSFRYPQTAEDLKKILDAREIVLNPTVRAGKYLIYTKNSETLEDLLTFMGAGNETLNLIGVKVMKSVRNRLNRQNNFETSNILKTADTAYLQTRAIKKLQQAGRLATLPEELYEVATLRLEYPDASLAVLSRMSKAGLTRSGFNHRMKKLLELAENIK